MWETRSPNESCVPNDCYIRRAPLTRVVWNGANVKAGCGNLGEIIVDGYQYYRGDYVEDISGYCGQYFKICRKAV